MPIWLKSLYFLSLVCLIVSLFSFVSFRKNKGLFSKLKYFFKLIIFFSLSASFILVAVFLKNYQAFDREKLVAEVTFSKVNGKGMELTFKQLPHFKENKFVLRGEQWMVGGDVLRWRRPLYLLGLNSLHKLTRVSGRYLDTGKEQFASHQEINGGTDKLWLLLYKNQKTLPFIEAVYGNAAYTFPRENRLFKVYVNSSGYLIKEEPLYPRLN